MDALPFWPELCGAVDAYLSSLYGEECCTDMEDPDCLSCWADSLDLFNFCFEDPLVRRLSEEVPLTDGPVFEFT